MVQTASLHGTHALGLEFGSAARLSKRSGSVWNRLWGHSLKRSSGIIRKSRVLYPGPGFLSSATWPLKKHYNGLINQSILYSELMWTLSKLYVVQSRLFPFFNVHLTRNPKHVIIAKTYVIFSKMM